MNNIKRFKYINTKQFNVFLNEYNYKLDDVKGYSLSYKRCYRGNILKQYIIYLSDHDHIFFSVVYFKSYNEYRQSALGFNGDRLLSWYNDANIRKYKHVIF